MKTDEFSDAIRRKLDSVSPPFQEKKWAQFQQYMHQAGFPPSVWQSPRQWWQPALSAATVTGLVVASVWQYQANKTLNQHVQTLTQSIERLERAQTSLQQSVMQLSQTNARPDTVYVVQQQDRTGASVLTYQTEPPRLAQRLVQPERTGAVQPDDELQPTITARPTDGRGVTPSSVQLAQRPGLRYTQPRPATDRTTLPDNNAGMAAPASASSAIDVPTIGRAASPDPVPKTNDATVPSAATRLARGRRFGPEPVTGSVNQSTRQPNIASTTPAYDNTRYTPLTTKAASAATPAALVQTTSDEPVQTASSGVEPLAVPVPQAVQQVIQPLNPLGISLDREALATNWANRLRRVRYRSPYASVAVAAPENRPTPPTIQWRLGLGGEVSTAQSGLGVNTEVVVGRWALSAGIGQAYWQGDAFKTEAQFAEKTRRNFRNQYPSDGPFQPTPGSPRAVIDISRSGRALMIPLQVAYRLAVGKQIQVAPFLGLNISLDPSETIHFDYERPFLRPPRNDDDAPQRLSVSRPMGWYSSWALGFSAEKQWGHFVGQLSPFAAMPIALAEPSLNTASVGLRARVYYQF
ncbi:hypothetical protein [Fibrella aquatilis]|uniref:Outer membrane protein beta-barrel domain-containing protein n=1 Tax=Fibrella aquatilis TaxID=2817059 RepID=A0A939G506_9BACT|nr:hypothetical protein [Fibrella aquatilis]MBO0931303.1 hypothetical protein [Fibrella aquatilis]